jgi:hypothetical protein
MPSTPVDRGVGLTVTLALPVNPDDGRTAFPEPTLVVPLASVTRSVAPAQAGSMPETATLVIRPDVSIDAANTNPFESQLPTEAMPAPREPALVGMAAAEAMPAARRAPISPAANRNLVSAATRARGATSIA